jgi:SNF2 family DNA or RNA helicase
MVEKSPLLLPPQVQRSYIHGSTPQKKRAREIDTFVHAESGAVIFLSVRSAGCGLNLQSASDAIMMEPLLNKGLEKQCVGRINRIGRVGRPTVHRLYLSGTIEQRILELDDDVVMTRETLLGLL